MEDDICTFCGGTGKKSEGQKLNEKAAKAKGFMDDARRAEQAGHLEESEWLYSQARQLWQKT